MKNIILSLSLSFLVACTNNPSDIGNNVIICCANSSYQTFVVTTKNIPAFLDPLMVSNFSAAFATHGLQPVSENADLDVELRYEQQDLIAPAEYDGFDERIAPGGDVRFVAKIVVEMRDASTNATVWSGSIQRIHEVSPGEFMHTGRASISLFNSFNELLDEYPGEEK